MFNIIVTIFDTLLNDIFYRCCCHPYIITYNIKRQDIIQEKILGVDTYEASIKLLHKRIMVYAQANI